MNQDDFVFHIGGEATKRHTIPVDMLVEIAKNLQELIQKLVLLDLPSDEPIDVNNFKIELAKFSGGSATPTFVFTENINTAPIGAISEQRHTVHKKFNTIMSYADSGNYLKLRDAYREPNKRNEIVDSVYSFVQSFGNAPVEILDNDNKPLYTIKKFKKSVKDSMITEVKRQTNTADREKNYQVGKVLVTRDKFKGVISQKVVELFDARVRPDYSTDTIIAGKTVYELNFQLHCSVETGEEYFQIENDMLGIFGQGKTIDEAEKSFGEEFDYIYKRYNELSDKKLTKDVQKIKQMMHLLVKNVSK